jgi:hypothetical protein
MTGAGDTAERQPAIVTPLQPSGCRRFTPHALPVAAATPAPLADCPPALPLTTHHPPHGAPLVRSAAGCSWQWRGPLGLVGLGRQDPRAQQGALPGERGSSSLEGLHRRSVPSLQLACPSRRRGRVAGWGLIHDSVPGLRKGLPPHQVGKGPAQPRTFARASLAPNPELAAALSHLATYLPLDCPFGNLIGGGLQRGL